MLFLPLLTLFHASYIVKNWYPYRKMTIKCYDLWVGSRRYSLAATISANELFHGNAVRNAKCKAVKSMSILLVAEAFWGITDNFLLPASSWLLGFWNIFVANLNLRNDGIGSIKIIVIFIPRPSGPLAHHRSDGGGVQSGTTTISKTKRARKTWKSVPNPLTRTFESIPAILLKSKFRSQEIIKV